MAMPSATAPPHRSNEQVIVVTFAIAFRFDEYSSACGSISRNSMQSFSLILKLAAPVFFIAGALHLALGAGADVLLGAQLPAEALADAALDSQNRFYGVSFTLYGVLLFLCSTNLSKYATVLRCVIWVFFAAGVARLLSLATHGVPPPPVIGLLASELFIPPLLAWWLTRVERANGVWSQFRRHKAYS
jgi:hypothetical protein